MTGSHVNPIALFLLLHQLTTCAPAERLVSRDDDDDDDADAEDDRISQRERRKIGTTFCFFFTYCFFICCTIITRVITEHIRAVSAVFNWKYNQLPVCPDFRRKRRKKKLLHFVVWQGGERFRTYGTTVVHREEMLSGGRPIVSWKRYGWLLSRFLPIVLNV